MLDPIGENHAPAPIVDPAAMAQDLSWSTPLGRLTVPASPYLLQLANKSLLLRHE